MSANSGEHSFMRFATIHRETVEGKLETPEHLYHRMREFIKDLKVLPANDLQDHSIRPDKMSATTETLVVLRWLEVLHPLLPALVAEKFADDLRVKTLIDLQSVICERVNQLLLELQPGNEGQVEEDVDSASRNDENDSSSRDGEKCVSCGAVRQLTSERSAKYEPDKDCGNILRTSNVEVGEQREAEGKLSTPSSTNDTEFTEERIQQVQPRLTIIESPQYKVKMNSISVTMILDTGCTGSLISTDICVLTGVEIRPSKHCAVQADGDSHLKVVGEIYTTIVMDDCLTLPVNALVVSKLKAGFIVGMAFMKRHKAIIDMENNTLSFQK